MFLIHAHYYRQDRGLSLSQLSELSGLSEKQLYCIEHGKPCSVATAKTLARVLAIPRYQQLGYESEHDETILTWWQQHGFTFNRLSLLACLLLVIGVIIPLFGVERAPLPLAAWGMIGAFLFWGTRALSLRMSSVVGAAVLLSIFHLGRFLLTA